MGPIRATGMLQHGTTLVVALCFAAIAFADGGFSTELIAAGAIAIWWVVIVGILARWWRGGGTIAREALLAGALLAALGAWTALSLLWAGDSGRAFAEVVRVAAYLGLFVLAVLAVGSVGARPLLLGLAAGLTAVAVAALATRLLPGVFGTDDPEIFAILPAAAGRLSFPIGYWNGLGACMAALVALLAWFGVAAGTRAWRAIAVALIPLPVLVLYFASSRGGLAAALAGVAILALLTRRRARLGAGTALGALGGAALVWLASRNADLVNGLDTDSARSAGLALAFAAALAGVAAGWLRHRLEPRLDAVRVPRPGGRASAAIAVLALAGVALLANPIERVEEFSEAPSAAAERRPAAGDIVRGSGSGRYQYWEAALDAFASDPFKGIGAGNYELWWSVHGTLARQVVDAHSLYLETLGELGLVGALLLAGFVAAIVAAAWRGMRDGLSPEGTAAAALVGAGLLSSALDWTWEIPAAFIPAILGAAVLTAAPAARVRLVGVPEREGPPPERRSIQGDRFGAGVATLAVAWASIWAAGVLLITEVKLDDSREAAARGDLDAAVQDAVDAGAVQPWSPQPPLQEAQVELLRGEPDAARAAVRSAMEKAPGDWRMWFVAARVERAAGNAAGAREALGRASELAPLPLPAGQGSAP